jgi:hypothetical protein
MIYHVALPFAHVDGSLAPGEAVNVRMKPLRSGAHKRWPAVSRSPVR